jgi:hypothetical protein
VVQLDETCIKALDKQLISFAVVVPEVGFVPSRAGG